MKKKRNDNTVAKLRTIGDYYLILILLILLVKLAVALCSSIVLPFIGE